MAINFLVGTDPELFVSNGERFVSGYGMIKGTKDEPLKVKNGAVQVDGHALEFNIDPASSEDDFVSKIASVRSTLAKMIGHKFTLATQPVADFGLEYLMAQPEEANVLGCDPDFNAWLQGQANPRPDGNVPFRTAGGHVHIGWCGSDEVPLVDIDDPEHQEACQMLIRELDFYLGIPSLFWDDNDMRREMYGKAGAYRAKPYGVEYRSLSNKWLSNEELIRYVYRQTILAATNLANGKSMAESFGGCASYAINNNDRDLAKEIIQQMFPDFGLSGSVKDIPKAA
tara:strand:- start:20011 stop:20862 length:852 start_codon:yes stop_codon:yes gene_type:complete